MATIDDIISRVSKVNVKENIQTALENTANDLVQFQRGQMLLGEDSKGGKIGKYKNPKYARIKANMNPLPGYGFFDLRLTGEFQKNIFVDIRDVSVVFTSADPKTLDLVDRLGETIFGLNTKSAGEYSKLYLGPEFIKIVRYGLLKL